MASSPGPLKGFEPDEVIQRIEVWVDTANIWRAGTDDNVHLRLFTPPGAKEAWQVNLDNSHENFEVGSRDYFEIPNWYFAGRIMADISIVQLYKNADDINGGWAFAGLQININNRNWYTRGKDQPVVWLENPSASRHWTEPNPPLVPFKAPTLGPQSYTALPSKPIAKPVQILGGKPPFRWKLNKTSGSTLIKPFIDEQPDPARDRVITGTPGPDMSQWTGEIVVTDADGRTGTASLKIESKLKLDPPTVTGVSPDFGWCDGFPSAPGASVFTVSGRNFDMRPGKSMKATFVDTKGAPVQGSILATSQTDTAYIVVPDGAVSGPIEIKTEAGKAATGAVTIHPSPYRFHYGFAFRNAMEDDNAFDGFPNTFGWGRYEEAYGVDGMWVMTLMGATVPDPFAFIFYLATKDLIDQGCCHGFSMVSLRIRQGIVGHLQFPDQGQPYPLQYTLWDKRDQAAPDRNISEMIQAGQLAMMSFEAFEFYIGKMLSTPRVSGKPVTMDARPMLGDVTKGLANGWSDPQMIAFAKLLDPTEGHVVVPYAATANTVDVYNPNRAGKPTGLTSDPGSIFKVNNATGNWSFDMGSLDLKGTWQPEIWSGLYCFSIPLSAYGRQNHWSMVASLDTLGKILLGSCIGGPGTIVEPLSGLRDMPTIGTRPMRALEGATRLRVTSKDGPGLVSIMLKSGQALSVEEIHGSVIVEVDPKAGTARVVEEQLSSDIRPVLRLVTRNRLRSVSQTYAVRATAGVNKGAIGLGWSGKQPKVVAEVASVDLHTRRVDSLAHDDAVELAGLPRGVADGADISLSDRGEIGLKGANGKPVDLATVRRFESIVPPQVTHGAQPITAQIRAGGRLAGGGAVVMVPKGPIVLGDRFGRGGGPVTRSGKGATIPRANPLQVDMNLGSASGTLAVRGRAPSQVLPPRGRLQLKLETTSELVSVVEERDGYRAFPRGVLVGPGTVVGALRSPLVIVAEPGLGRARARGSRSGATQIPLTLVTYRAACNAVTLDLGPWRKICGTGSKMPGEPDFILSPALQAAGATLTKVSNGERGPTIGIAWPAERALSGRIALGSLVVTAPAQPGSIWVMKGDASASGQGMGDVDVRVVPIELRRPGTAGSVANPAFRRAIGGPERVGEGEKIELTAPGVDPKARDVGWWVTDGTGQARISAGVGGKAMLQGWMAGVVRVNAMVGDDVLNRDILVEPRTGWSPLAADAPATLNTRIPGLPALEIDPLRLSPWQVLRDQVWNPPRDILRVDIGHGLRNTDLVKPGGRSRKRV